MIQFAGGRERPVGRRFGRLLPLRPWLPCAVRAAQIEASHPSLAESQATEAPMLLAATPNSDPIAGFAAARATSCPIGWFPEVNLPRPGSFQVQKPAGPPLGVKVPVASAGPADDLLRRLAALLQPPLSSLLNPDGVLEWPAPLLPFQRDGVAALLRQRELLLADDMGLGKTIQAIAALRVLCSKGELRSALVVCPASLVSQWTREFQKWAPELTVVTVAGPATDRGVRWRIPAHIRLISYDTLRGDVLDLRDSPALRTLWSVVILDEASRIKNADTGVSVACKLLPRDRRWALTGTPLENRLDDVASILDFLLGEPDRPRLVRPDQVRETLRTVQLRRKKEDVLTDLPPKQVIDKTIDLLPAQQEAYDLAEQQGVVRLREAGPLVTVTHVLELISRLKQVCNRDAGSGESAKMADIEERMATLTEEGHRALIFSQFTDDDYGVAMAARRLALFFPLTYTGAMSAAEKADVVGRFASAIRHKALVLSLRAGGVGLNLQSASYVFHLDRWWNPAIEEQADSRAHRMGQAFPVTVFRYVCARTIEERIEVVLKAKRQLFLDVVDEVSIDLADALSAEELFGLFDLQPPRRFAETLGRASDFRALTGPEFEQWLGAQLVRAGFSVETTSQTRDGGIDLVATRSDLVGIETRLVIQCKNSSDPVGVAVVRELRGVVPDRAPGTTPVLASPGGFTTEARHFAKSAGVLLWQEGDLRSLAGPAGE